MQTPTGTNYAPTEPLFRSAPSLRVVGKGD